jgi:hypothetical protein
MAMRPTAKNVSPREVRAHFVNGAGLGAFLALSLIAGNSTIFNTIVNAPYPKAAVLVFVVGFAGFIGIGSAISGFIMTALDKT